MRFVTAMKDNTSFVGVVDENLHSVLHLRAAAEKLGKQTANISDTMIECIKNEEVFVKETKEILAAVEERKEDFYYPINEVTLLAPIPRPMKNIFCVGKNYADHAKEMGSGGALPEYPIIFSKAPTSVTTHEAAILNHKDVTNELDYEGELAVIIGKNGRGISKEEAFDYVFGYTIINDVTARDLQANHQQYLLGKSLDTTCPMGPSIVHHSLIKDPHHLNIETKVNDEVRQAANTEQFIFDIPTLIATLSKGMTLEAGDIIATGTPAGVGKGFKPPKLLSPGDTVEITIEHVGTLRNYIEK